MKIKTLLKPLRALAGLLLLGCVPAAAQSPGSLEALDLALAGGTGGQSYAIAQANLPDGGLIVGGNFATAGAQPHANIVKVGPGGTIDHSFTANVAGAVYSVVVQPDGKIVIGGLFNSVNNYPIGIDYGINNIARLHPNGTLDTSFHSALVLGSPFALGGFNGRVRSIAVQPDGMLVVVGEFTSFSQAPLGSSSSRIARLTADGSIDLTFNTSGGVPLGGANGPVYTCIAQANGKILIGGDFTILNGTAGINRLARLNADGSRDTSFSASLNGPIYSTVVQPDGYVVVGGDFTSVNGSAVNASTGLNRLVRLTGAGATDSGFSVAGGANAWVYGLALQSDGKILMAGGFTTLFGVSGVGRVARLNTNGTRDTSFGSGLVLANNHTNSVTLQADGRVLVGSIATTMNGVTRVGFAKLNNDAASQSLGLPAAGQVTWTRGGSAPDLSQATFETGSSLTGPWTALATASRVGTTTNWTATGLTLPTPLFLRARGRTLGGHMGGSSGLIEQIASFNLPTVTTTTQTNVGGASADLGGDVTATGGAPVTERGIVWATTATPTTANNKVANGNGPGAFSGNVTGLPTATLIYVRAYATNSVGTAYGNQISFIPGVYPYAFVSLQGTPTTSSAVLRASVWDQGTPRYTWIGVVWSPATIPDTSPPGTGNTRVPYLAGTAPNAPDCPGCWAETSVGGMNSNSLIHTRAFTETILPGGYTMGPEITFTTLAAVSTAAQTTVTANSATLGGTVAAGGGAAVSDRGIVWSTATMPTNVAPATAGTITKVGMGTGTGAFSGAVNSLPVGTTVFCRAYAVNAGGYSYGAEISFTTPPVLPTVTTAAHTSITATSAVLGGNVTATGGATVTERGIVWAVSPAIPTTAGNKVANGSGAGAFSGTVSGLPPATTINVCAYAINSAGTAYGAHLSCTTPPALATVTTTTQSNVTPTSAVLGGNVTATGGAPVTERGIVWAPTPTPTTANNKVPNGSGLGSFSSTVAVTSACTIYVRAYAINAAGTAYGSQTSFVSATLPTVTTAAPTSITINSAILGGNVTDSGGGAIIQKGIVWSLTPNPTVLNHPISSGPAGGPYSSLVTGFPYGTQIYVRAYAGNCVGTAYGNEITFTPLRFATVVTSPPPAGAATMTLGGNVTDNGGSAITERGIFWGTSSVLTGGGNKVVATLGSGTGAFSLSVSSLPPGRTIYFSAYAINTLNSSFGNELTFATPAVVPTLTTANPLNITRTSAKLGGQVTSTGGAPITERGIEWSAGQVPMLLNAGTGSFADIVAGLPANAAVTVRAYAKNSVGTGYGNTISFNTASLFPVFRARVMAKLAPVVGGVEGIPVAEYRKDMQDCDVTPVVNNGQAVTSGTLAPGEYSFLIDMEARQGNLYQIAANGWYYLSSLVNFQLGSPPSSGALTRRVGPDVTGQVARAVTFQPGLNYSTTCAPGLPANPVCTQPPNGVYLFPPRQQLTYPAPSFGTALTLPFTATFNHQLEPLFPFPPPIPASAGSMAIWIAAFSPYSMLSSSGIQGTLGFDSPTNPSQFACDLLWPNFVAGGGSDVTTTYGLTWKFTVTQSTGWNWSIIANNPCAGASPQVPVLPDPESVGPPWIFGGPTGYWFDPPAVWGYRYTMTGASKFTAIQDFPPGFPHKFMVQAPGMASPVLRGPGEPMDFTAITPGGVTTFDVTGIVNGSDSSNPQAFPIKLGFNTAMAEFTMEPLAPPPGVVIPPASVLFQESATDRYLHFTGKLKRGPTPSGPWEYLTVPSPLRTAKSFTAPQREFYTADPEP